MNGSSFHLPAPPWIAGHRGAAAEAIENTLDSFRLAVEQGADLLELDVQMCADGELLVVHDWDLRRLTGSPLVVERSSAGAVRAQALQRLREPGRPSWPGMASLRRRAAGQLPGDRIPTLGDVLAMRPPSLPLNIELKRRVAHRGRFAEAVLAATAGHEPLLFSSFDWDLLAELRRRAPHVCLAPLASRWPSLLLEAGRNLRAWSLHAHRRIVSPALVERARAARRPLLVYTVNDVAEARRLFAWGVAGVFSDRPGALRAALGLVARS